MGKGFGPCLLSTFVFALFTFLYDIENPRKAPESTIRSEIRYNELTCTLILQESLIPAILDEF